MQLVFNSIEELKKFAVSMGLFDKATVGRGRPSAAVKAKPGPKPKATAKVAAKTSAKASAKVTKVVKAVKGKPGPKPKATAKVAAKAASKPSAKTATKTAAKVTKVVKAVKGKPGPKPKATAKVAAKTSAKVTKVVKAVKAIKPRTGESLTSKVNSLIAQQVSKGQPFSSVDIYTMLAKTSSGINKQSVVTSVLKQMNTVYKHVKSEEQKGKGPRAVKVYLPVASAQPVLAGV